MGSLPTGKVTFLFTDIEGSTRLLDALGAQYSGVVANHDRIIRGALERNRGVEVNTEGDSFFAVFRSAADAVSAATEAQRELAMAEGLEPLRVRMGLHTGQAELAGRDYIGLDVNRAARIASAAHGGQVLLSSATRVEVADTLRAGVALRDLGEHRLKDFPGHERLHQLVLDGLVSDFPPPRSLEITPTNLPQQLTSFFGRRRELADAQRLLKASRLVTLTGPGGSGKTRLGIRLAEESLAGFPGGVYFVPLAALRDPDLVLPEIAQAFSVKQGADLRGRLIQEIGSKEILLILDNFEHLAAAASTVGALLADTPRLKVLVTSRSPLGVYGEREYPVPPLAVPDSVRLPPLHELERADAIALFVDRARAVRADYELTAANAPTIAQICARLDGLPLAIELAAARVKLLTEGAILARLQDSLALLATAAPGVPERQRTLRGTIEWSYDLLTQEDRLLFNRLGVFLGGAPLAVIASVLEDQDELSLIERLGSLIDKSLMRRADADTELRIEMLETIREFASERLAASGERGRYRERHALAYASLLDEAAPHFQGHEGGRWLDRIAREHDNIRAAFTWAVETSRADLAGRMAFAAWRFWQMRGHLDEGRDRAEEALRLSANLGDPALRGLALEAAGSLAYWQADFAASRKHYAQALELQRQLGDEAAIANALYNLSHAEFVSREDPERGRQLSEEALAIYRRIGDRTGIANTLWALGGMENLFPDARIELARRYFQESRQLFEELGNRRMLAWAHFMYAGTEMRHRGPGEARPAAQQALRIFNELGDVSGCALTLRGLSVIEWVDGHREAAARLGGVADRLQRTTGVHLADWTSGRWAEWGAPEPLNFSVTGSDPALAAAWAEGEQLDVQEAVAEVLRAPASASLGPSHSATDHPSSQT